MLVALLFPVAKSSIQNAQTGKCAGNLRAIGGALANYIADHDGELIPGATENTHNMTWLHVLEPYLGGPSADGGAAGVYDPNRPAWQTCPAKKYPADQRSWLAVGYGWNQVYFGATAGYVDANGDNYCRINQVSQPSKTIIIADNVDSISAAAWQYPMLYGPWGTEGMLSMRHHGGGNYLFLDGHVEWLKREEAVRTEQGIPWFLFRRVK